MVLSRALIALSESEKAERLVRREFFARSVVSRFVAGDGLADAIAAGEGLRREGIGAILDLLGEGTTDAVGAEGAADEYCRALRELHTRGLDATISVKLSQLGLNVDRGVCVENLLRVCGQARESGSSVELDMEGSADVDASLDVYRQVQRQHPDVRIALQAYLRRTPQDVESIRGLSPRVRLVKGAYAEDPAVALQHRDEIDEQFVFLAEWLARYGSAPAFGTHDERLIDRIVPLLQRAGAEDYEFQLLYGVRSDLQLRLAREGTKVRVYIPYGDAWFPYLTRRLAERPSNLRFFLRAALSARRNRG
ncbi:MAG: Proline dehydrogenase [Actinomycetia bacterium]|nr:Proline dehydrogenase [Actinomycetes bacterium]